MSWRYYVGVCFAVGGTFLFALKSIFIKLAFAEGVTPLTLLSMRMAFSLPFYVGMLTYLRSQDSEKPAASRREIVCGMLLGFLGYYLASLLDLSGLQYISAQLERLTLFTYPTMVALLAWMFLGEPLNRRIVLALILCYAGLYLMYRQEQKFEITTDVAWGMLLVMGSALSYSFYILFAKPMMQRIGSREFTSWAMIGSTVFVLLHAVVAQTGEAWQATRLVWVYGLILAFVCTVLPSFLVNEAIMRLGATRTTLIGSVGPVVTMGLAIVLLHEPTSVWHFLGMGIVILGATMATSR